MVDNYIRNARQKKKPNVNKRGWYFSSQGRLCRERSFQVLHLQVLIVRVLKIFFLHMPRGISNKLDG